MQFLESQDNKSEPHVLDPPSQ